MQAPPLHAPGVATPDHDAAPIRPAALVLVVERRRRAHEPEVRTADRIRACRPETVLTVAYSGWEALEVLRRGSVRFDLVVIDANVGWMDPVDFVRRAQTMHPLLPAIITSAMGYGAVLVPPASPAEEPRVLVRQLVRGVLRELRSGPVPDPAEEDGSGETRPGRGILAAGQKEDSFQVAAKPTKPERQVRARGVDTGD